MLPDTIAAFADRSATAANTSQARNMLPDTIAAFADRSAIVANTSQAEYLLPDVTFAARSATAANTSQARNIFRIQSQPSLTDLPIAANTSQAVYLLPEVTFAARSATPRLRRLHRGTTSGGSHAGYGGGTCALHGGDKAGAGQCKGSRGSAGTRFADRSVDAIALRRLGRSDLGSGESARVPALAGMKEMAEERYLMVVLQNPGLLALVQAEEASQSQHVGLTVGELARLASDESQHEATESPVEAAFEAAEAAITLGCRCCRSFPEACDRNLSMGDRSSGADREVSTTHEE